MKKYVNGVYINMTQQEINKMSQISIHEKIRKLKEQLSQSDYKAIKYAEGQLSENEYESIRTERQRIREQINELSKM